jgi:Family of unknown function (DUF6491)
MTAGTKILAILLCSFICNACASDGGVSRKDRACLFANQPQSWQVLDDEQLVLWGPAQKGAYLVKLFAPVPDLRFAETLAFIDGDHNGMICGGDADKIAVPRSHITSFPAIISSMRKVDEAELVTLGEKYKVKLISDKKAQEIKKHDKQIHTGSAQ